MRQKDIEDYFLKIARKIPLWAYPKLIQRPSLDIFYHLVSDEDLVHVKHLYAVVPIETFERSLDYLSSHYHFVEYKALEAHYLLGKALPEKALHLSFDDGYVECYSVIRPILLRRGIPATFFVTTNLVDNRIVFYRNKVSLCVDKIKSESIDWESLQAQTYLRVHRRFHNRQEYIDWLKSLRAPEEEIIDELCGLLDINLDKFLKSTKPYLTKKQIRQMQKEGFTIGAHTKTHRKLGKLSAQEIEEEIAGSCRVILEMTGEESVPLSFPNSGAWLDRNYLAQIRRNYSFIGLFFDTKGFRQDAPFIVNRIWAERPIVERGNIEDISVILKYAYADQLFEAIQRKIITLK